MFGKHLTEISNVNSSTNWCNIYRFGISLNGVDFDHGLFGILLAAVCWTQTDDVHGFGGIPHSLTTSDECQAACIKNNTCVAIDWELTNVGKTCWILTSSETRNTTQQGAISHYELHRGCHG